MARLTSAMVRLSSLERESGGVKADDIVWDVYERRAGFPGEGRAGTEELESGDDELQCSGEEEVDSIVTASLMKNRPLIVRESKIKDEIRA
jgi:hypothetical protein